MRYSILYALYTYKYMLDMMYHTIHTTNYMAMYFVIYEYTQHHILYTMISLARPTPRLIGSHFWSCGQPTASHECE